MASTTPRLPEQYGSAAPDSTHFHVSELAADMAGALSPFGSELQLPLPLDKILYTHPGPADRPYLADGR